MFFLEYKFNSFGTYQDTILEDNVYIYHSNISSSLNIGILSVEFVYQTTIDYCKKNKVSINNIEGFLRQVLGWREYMRYIYVRYPDITKQNKWNANRGLVWKYWDGTRDTGIDFLDNEIKKVVKHSYCHHIIRLMIFLNIFVLIGVHPDEIINWFMRFCSIDAYHWCMISNVYSMGYFDDRFMRKPYISSSNYINKMSNYKKNVTFDSLYYKFLDTHRKNKNIGFYGNSLRYFVNMDLDNRSKFIKTADEFINKATKVYKKYIT